MVYVVSEEGRGVKTDMISYMPLNLAYLNGTLPFGIKREMLFKSKRLTMARNWCIQLPNSCQETKICHIIQVSTTFITFFQLTLLDTAQRYMS